MKGVKRSADDMREYLSSFADKDGCWRFNNLDSRGYGLVQFEGRLRSSHRVAYELFVGPIPDGLQLDHLCRTRSCCNPEHLEPVTPAENARRAMPHRGTRTRLHQPGRSRPARDIAIPAHLKLALSAPEAAELISLSEKSIRRLVSDGHLARVPHTDRLLIARSELERFVASA